MLHNPPYALEKTIITERKFADVLKETYSRLDGLETKLREYLTEAIERFAADPTDAAQWRVENAVTNQTTLSIVVQIRTLINHAETMEEAAENFKTFADRYRQYVVAWAAAGENSSSALSNITSRITLAATAKEFGSWGLANDIERAIAHDIEETKKRLIVTEFVDLAVDEWFRLLPSTDAPLFRKLSPRKAIKGVYPSTKNDQIPMATRDKVYVFRIPLETDTVYSEAA